MKPKNFIGIVLLLALVGIGLWWLLRPTVTAPQKTTEAPITATADASIPAAPLHQIAQPLAPVAQVKPATATPTDPQTELKTTITDIESLFRGGKLVVIYQTYFPPDKQDPEEVKRRQESESWGAANRPFFELMNERNAQAWEALESQTPTYNAAGDEATYMLQVPTYPDQDVPNEPSPITFVKIKGKWYIKEPTSD